MNHNKDYHSFILRLSCNAKMFVPLIEKLYKILLNKRQKQNKTKKNHKKGPTIFCTQWTVDMAEAFNN